MPRHYSEARRAKQKAYRARRKDHFNRLSAEWKKRNAERVREQSRVRYRLNRDKILKQAKKWRNENKLATKISRELGITIAQARGLFGGV